MTARAVAMARTALMFPAVEAVERSSIELMKAAHDWGVSALCLLLEFSNSSSFFLASASWGLIDSAVSIVALAAWK